jgi:hypothetical protein
LSAAAPPLKDDADGSIVIAPVKSKLFVATWAETASKRSRTDGEGFIDENSFFL